MWRNGRRAGFRFQCWETCGFKSRHPHQVKRQSHKDSAISLGADDGIIEQQTVWVNNTRLPEFSPFRRIRWRNFANAKAKKTSPRYLWCYIRFLGKRRSLGRVLHRVNTQNTKKRAARTLFLHLVRTWGFEPTRLSTLEPDGDDALVKLTLFPHLFRLRGQ